MTITKKIVCLLLVLYITYSSHSGCLYNTNSSCTANGCFWGDGLCGVSSNITNCLDGYYYQVSVNDTGCLPCTNLDNSTCSILCPDYDFVPGLGCIPCSFIDINCISCIFIQSILGATGGARRLQTAGINTCELCKVGFQLNPNDNTSCIPAPCNILNCLACESNSTCGICQTGYIVCLNGTACCPTNCTVPNCIACLTPLNCGPCQDGYTPNCDNTACNPICPTNCGNCTNPNSCTQCLSGYVFSSTLGYCVLMCQVQYCATCASSTTCSGCVSGYSVAPCGTVCVPNGTPNCMIASSPTCCQTCNPGYVVLSNGTCGPAICYITNCLVCSSCTTCSQCNQITSLNSNGTKCIYNCLSVISNCVSCSSNTTCSACAAGYVINSTSQCNPACTIANCAICLTSGLCQYCKADFTLTCTGTCTINCGIPNCVTCNSSSTCLTCATNYQRSPDCTQCILVCSPGYYIATAVNGTQSCQLCSLTIPNCYLCATSQLITNPLTCLACWDFYYINGAGFCSLCSNAISNCLTCNSPGTCTQCANEYVLYTNKIGASFCEMNYCNVTDCYYCSPTSSQICITCSESFERSSDGLSCDLIVCIDTQFYDPITNQCLCPIGTYLTNDLCKPCRFTNCLTCNAAGCNTCAAGYFLSVNLCQTCPPHCLTCTSNTSCTQCNVDFTLSGTTCIRSCGCGVGVLATGNGTVQLCPAGCANCGISQGAIYCINPSPGYSFNHVGDIIKCLSKCLTCARANYTICITCPGASIISGGSCVGCVDLYAASCSPSTLSTSCIPGYSVFNGTCKACDPNCIYCGNSGPGNCDYNQCNSGYVLVEGTTNCTACFNGCSSCSQNNPSLCLSCSGADYLDNSSNCQPCPSICQTCSTDTICTSCYPGFTLLADGRCYNYIGYPCYKQLQDKCVACYPGYKLSITKTCVINITCSTSSTCKSCPLKYYLTKGKCVTCLTNSLCGFCDPLIPNQCLTCISGYYLDSTDNNCYTCDTAMPGCLNCTTNYFCTHAGQGYYISVDVDGNPTGNIKPCADSCDTCVSPTCLTCAASYTRFGGFCLYEQYVSGTITLGPGPGTDWFTYSTSSQQTLAYAVANSGQIIAAILALSGLSIAQFDSILLKSVGLGSLVVQYAVGVSPEVLSVEQLNNNLQSGTIPDFNTLSHSTSINAKSTTNDGNGSGANLGLILGITIPLVILLVVVIVFIKIYSSDTDEKETEETDKGVNEYEM